jgi:hypothetical protein
MALYRNIESSGGVSGPDRNTKTTIRFDERDFGGGPKLDLTLSAHDAQHITNTVPRQRPPLLNDPDDVIRPTLRAPERNDTQAQTPERPARTGESLVRAISDAIADGKIAKEEALNILKAFFREARAITAETRAEWYASVPERDRKRLQFLIGATADGKIAKNGGGETIGRLQTIANAD